MRLFSRVYFVTLLLLLLGLLLPAITVWANVEHNSEAVRKMYHGQMVLASAKLRESTDREATLLELQEEFEFEVEMLDWPTEELPKKAVFMLPKGQTLVWVLPEERVVGYHLIDYRKVLRFGPMPALRFLGPPGVVGLVLLVIMGGFLVSRMVVRPIKKQGKALVYAANAMSAGNLAVQVPAKRVRDLADLGRAFNRMADRMRGVLIGQRQLLQDVSHELRTPLARVRFGLEMLREQAVEQPNSGRLLDQIDDTIGQLDRLVGELLEYTRLADQDRLHGRNEELDLAEIIQTALSRVSLDRERGREIDAVLPAEPLPLVLGNRRELGRALDNLIGNALRFAQERVQVTLRSVDGWIEIAVDDDGPGIPADRRERVLEPFVQLERDHAHTGLGLAIASRIADGHGGEVEVGDSESLGGASIRIRIPSAKNRESFE